MNDKGHFLISMTKSGVRILGSVIAIKKRSIAVLASALLGAEILGIAEELVDKDKGVFINEVSSMW